MFIIILFVYLILGFLLLWFNPAKQVIKDEFFKFSMTNSLAAVASHKKLSVETRILIFKIAIITGFILLWPILYSGVIKQYKANHEHVEDISTAEGFGVKFMFMGGHGALSCGDCGFSQELTSSTHGYHRGDEGLHKCSTSGFQCQSCGKLTTKEACEESLVCECGGKLDREELLFCPKCKSKSLDYNMHYIT